MQIGVLLINLGTPAAATPSAIRKYLREFLSDLRVIELPRWLWLPILYGFVLTQRPNALVKKYQKIWTEQGSPLFFHTKKQAEALQIELNQLGWPPTIVTYAMRYGEPNIQQMVTKLCLQGCQHILAIPLYPQYATSSTASALDVLYATVQNMRNPPSLHIVKDFYNEASYIAAVTKQIRYHWQQHEQGDHLLFSFHGVPVTTVIKGDPYFDQCHQTAYLIAAELELTPDQYTVAFQSRFGKTQWVKPATDQLLQNLAQTGIKRLDIICPGFVADCLETLEEIAIEGKQLFETHGGLLYRYIPCLNTNDDWITTLANLCQKNLPAWLTSPTVEKIGKTAI